MGGGGPQATRISENPVGSSGISPERRVGGVTPGAPDRSARRLASLLLPPLGLMGVVWFLSAQPDLSSGLKQDFFLRKCAHVTEFGLLTLLWARALAGLGRAAVRRAAPWAAAAIALTWAAVDERHQHFVEGRVGTIHDVGIDAIGIVLAVALLHWTPLGERVGVPRPPRDARSPGTTTGRESPAGGDRGPEAPGRRRA